MKKILVISLIFCSHVLIATNRVAVIGAGAAGISAGQRLKSAGFNVVLFEKNQRIGGKCNTKACKKGHGVVELGAIQVGTAYPKVNFYRKELGLKLRDYWPAQSLRYDAQGQKPVIQALGEDLWPYTSAPSIASEVMTMNDALARFKPIADSFFDEIPEDSEFLKPFEQWADELGLSHFKEDYRVWITSYGYGQLDTIPAYLPLSLINSSIGMVMLRRLNMNLRMLSDGYGGLMNAIVKHYELDVKTGVSIQKIKRHPKSVSISFNDQQGNSQTMKFDYLVVACGMQAIPNFFDKAITKEEQQLVDDLVYEPYDVVIADIPKLEKGGYVLPQNLQNPGHVSLISKNSAAGEDVILYIPRGQHKRPSREQLEKIVKEDMARFGFQVPEIFEIKYWDTYFPHFSKPGSYHLLNQIQGQNRTVYVGSMARFEIVEQAISHAHDMVDLHLIKAEKNQPATLSAIYEGLDNWYQYFNASAKEDL